MTFQAFLTHTHAHDNPDGDFVRDARRHYDTQHRLIRTEGDLYYAMGANACHQAREASHRVWLRYQRYLRRIGALT